MISLQKQIFERLFTRFGPQLWWPAESPWEMMVGAILTQNTKWTNVEKAITNLKTAKVLDVSLMHQMPQKALAELIRPAGYFNVKAKRLKSLADFVMTEYDGSISRMKKEPLGTLRPKLLAVKGV